MIAEVVVDLPVLTKEFGFDYNIPPEICLKIGIGHEVTVPFSGRHVKGVVVALKEESSFDRLQDIEDISSRDTCLFGSSVLLAQWLAKRYICPSIDALRLFYPSYIEEGIKHRQVIFVGPSEMQDISLTALQQRLYDFISANPYRMTRAECARLCGVSPSVMESLIKKSAVRLITAAEAFGTLCDDAIAPPSLTEEQSRVMAKFDHLLAGIASRPLLLHGITSSGKTEVYMRMVEKILVGGRRAIILVPEIGLTPQISAAFRRRFGKRLAVMHSALSGGERASEWRRIASGAADIVMGPRSAIFAPVQNLGLIIIDEEHDPSYKQESSPRYHTRDIALKLADMTGAHLVLGSATPSLESYSRAVAGDYLLAEMKRRVADRSLPEIIIADMRQELKDGNRRVFSNALEGAAREALHNGKQCIFFLNRRGYSTFILCRSCGHTLKCPHCSVSLTFHLRNSRLTCHHCDFTAVPPDVCPNCRSHYIRHFGLGTEKLEEYARQEYPGAAVFRMDRDTTAHRGGHHQVVEAFGKENGSILIGTQMVTKGHDFSNVTVVGVIAADMSLNIQSFRAAERTFQLLTQVAGRAGRGSDAGTVILQTYNPDHPAIQLASAHDYHAFFDSEMAARRELNYPPFTRIINIISTDTVDSRAEERIIRLRSILETAIPEDDAIIGPAPAAIARIKDEYRWHMLLKSRDIERTLESLWNALLSLKQSLRRGIIIDVDAENML